MSRLDDTDIVARCALYPRYNDTHGVFSPERFVGLNNTTVNGSRRWVTSIACRKYLPTIADMHAYGCRAARAANARIEHDLQRAPRFGENRVYYRGYREIEVRCIRSINGRCYLIDAYWRPVENLREHGQIELEESISATKSQGAQARTAIIALLCSIFGPIFGHTCTEDSDVAELLPTFT